MTDNKFILDGMMWSFSSVNCYQNCPKCFFLSYIQKCTKSNNAFAQWGSFGHKLLEQYYSHEKEFFELSELYAKEYNEAVTIPFPPNKYVDMAESYFAAGQNYFDHFEGDFRNCEILGVEQKVTGNIANRSFVGYIDLLVKDDNGIIVCDHKSKSAFKNEKEKQEYLRQLYLYSVFVKEKYGQYPYKLMFNMFRTGQWEEEYFNEEHLQQSIDWFAKSVEEIYQATKFPDKISILYKAKKKKLSTFHKNDFFCNYICSVKEHCNRSKFQQRR